MAGFFIALFVDKCTACQVIGNPISDDIVSKMRLLTCPCLRGKRVKNSQAILEHLMTFGSNISTGKPEQLLSLMCVCVCVCVFFRFPEVERMVYIA